MMAFYERQKMLLGLKKDYSSDKKNVEEFAQETEQHTGHLSEMVRSLEKQVEDEYKSLEDEPHELQSIIIHEGFAESGHYYSFIKDFGSMQWYRYNDMTVKAVDEKEVFEVAYGGKSNANAYYLIYVRQGRLDRSIRQNALISEPAFKDEPYYQLLNSRQRDWLQHEHNDIVNKIKKKETDSKLSSIA